MLNTLLPFLPVILTFAGLIIAIIGISFIFGLGWGLFLLGILTGTPGINKDKDFHELNQTRKIYGSIKYKLFGLILLLCGAFIAYKGLMLFS